MRRKLIIGCAIMAAAAVGGWWAYLRPHVITVCAYTDPPFQTRNHWKETLETRFREVSRIYSGQTRVKWKVVEVPATDPERNVAGLDQRRRELLLETGCKADVLVEIATIYEGARRASVTAFSHVAVITDRPADSEQSNTLQLAHELAHLFGVSHDAAGVATIMAASPASETFSPRTAKLIRKLRAYPFAKGVAGLSAEWDSRAADALAESLTGLVPKPAVQAQQTLAAALSEDGDDDGAIRHYQAALKLDPSAAAARMELAGVLDRRSRTDDAVAVMREGLRVDPKNAAIHGGLGVLVAPHNREEAIDELMEAVRLQPRNAVYYSTLGMILLPGMGQIDEATTAFQDALRLSPGMVQAQQGLATAEALKKQGQDNAALVRAHAAREPRNGALQYDLGVAEAGAGNSTAAIQALERSLQLTPGFAQAHAALALVRYSRGDFAGAWRDVNAQQAQGMAVDQRFLAALTRKMPPPQNQTPGRTK
jgi:tetratricopeptide (TPR) repeat protein